MIMTREFTTTSFTGYYLSAEPFDSQAIELTLFLWHMPALPADTTERVAEHSAMLQTINKLACPSSYSLYVQLLQLVPNDHDKRIHSLFLSEN